MLVSESEGVSVCQWVLGCVRGCYRVCQRVLKGVSEGVRGCVVRECV